MSIAKIIKESLESASFIRQIFDAGARLIADMVQRKSAIFPWAILPCLPRKNSGTL